MTTDEIVGPELAELAATYGVSTDFWDWQGRHVQVGAATVRAVLAALGVPAGDDVAARASLEQARLVPWRRMLPPCIVTRAGWTPWFRVHVPHGEPIEVWVEQEDGGERRDLTQQQVWVSPREVDGRLVGEATFALPGDLPLGWHRLHARSGSGRASTDLVVTPAWLGVPEQMGGSRHWGFTVQLYSMCSQRSWGVGDLADLTDLASWSAHELGAGFVAINPLHAGNPVAPTVPSPYLPATRRFPSPMYVRVEEVVEFGYLDADGRAAVEKLAEGLQVRNRSQRLIDREAVWTAKRAALKILHSVRRSPGRQAVYEAFLTREGTGLVDFATWCALAEKYGLPWRSWPEPMRDPRSAEVSQARAELAEQIDFHCWLQWLLDEQIARAQRGARSGGMSVGIVHDLAVGVHPDGADTWSLQEVMASGVSVGAPADAFNQQGQDWTQPPWRPDRLAECGYGPYRDMLRTILRHAGGIRVDHVPGLFRLWWVPDGMPASAGTYVRYDHEALVGILALEAHRAGALVIGEDLGTVEPWVRDYLGERGIFGTSILWFEQDYEQGRPLRPEEWREFCLATVTTHDLPPTAGYLAGEHIRLRESLGLLTRPVEVEQGIDESERRRWLELLADLGLLAPDADERETIEALHRYLARTPARLIGVALADAVGERRAINQPGTDEEYPNWRLPLADGDGKPVLLEDIVASQRVRSLAAAVRPR